MTPPPPDRLQLVKVAIKAKMAVANSINATVQVTISKALLTSVLFLSCSTSTSSSFTLRFSFLNSSEFFLMATASNP